MTLTSQLMPGDTAAPSAPGTPTIVDKKLTTISFGWTPSASGDTSGYEWEARTAASGGGTQVSTGKVDATVFTLDQATIGFGATRYFRVRGLDYSKNAGSWSSDVSFSFVKVQTGDVGGGQITGPEISTGGVATGNVAANAITANGFYSNDAMSGSITADVEIGTITITTNGGAVLILAKVSATIDTALGSAVCAVGLRRDSSTGTILDYFILQQPTAFDYYLGGFTTMAIDASPAATQTYKLMAIKTSGAGVFRVEYRRLVALNLKR